MVIRWGHVLSAAVGAGVGFGASLLGSADSPGRSSEALEVIAPPLRSFRSNEHQGGADAAGSAGREAVDPPPADEAPAVTASEGRAPALAAELTRVREQEREAQKQLGEARKRIDTLERELGAPRARNPFDLAPEDWRKLGQEGVMKYRVPCSNPGNALSDAALDKMALAPDDRAVLEQAYANSASRLRQQLMPLCAAALGGRTELARAIGVDGCRHIIVNTAALRGEDALGSTRRVAAIMAGDAAPTPDLGMTDVAFLAFAEESGRFERELAESLGPEEARRIINSPEMCFSSAVHQFAPDRPASIGPP